MQKRFNSCGVKTFSEARGNVGLGRSQSDRLLDVSRSLEAAEDRGCCNLQLPYHIHYHQPLRSTRIL